MLRYATLVLIGLFGTGCCQATSSMREELSRSYIDVDMSDCGRPFAVSGHVGGEHVNYYSFRLRSGRKYELTITSTAGTAKSGLEIGGSRPPQINVDAKTHSYAFIASPGDLAVLDVVASVANDVISANYDLTLRRIDQ